MAGLAVLGSLALLVIASFAAQASGGSPQRVSTISASDSKSLRRLFFGGQTTVVECAGEQSALLYDVASRNLLPEGVGAALIECGQELAGGKSAADRFGLRLRASRRTLLLCGGGDAPRVIAQELTTSAEGLARHLKKATVPVVISLNHTIDLWRHCLSRSICLVTLSSGSLSSALKETLAQSVQRASVSRPRLLRPPSRDDALLGGAGLVALNRARAEASFSSQIPNTNRPMLLALRTRSGDPKLVEAAAYKGDLSKITAERLDRFFADLESGAMSFNAIKEPPYLSPVGSSDARAYDAAAGLAHWREESTL